MTSSPSHAPQSALQAAIGACTSSFLLVFAYSCGFNLLLLAPSIYLLQIYDRVLSSRSLDTLVMLTLMVAVAVIVGGILDVVRRAALSRIGGWFDDRLRPLVLAACLEYAYRVSPARANEAYRDLGTLRQFIESPLFALLFDLLWAPFFLVVLFMVHPLLGMIGVLCVILLFGFALAGELATRAPLAEAASAQARSHGRLWAMLNNIQVIKAMGMTEGAARLVYGETGAIQNALETVARRTERIQAFARPLRAVVQVLMMGTAAWLVLEEHRSPGIIFVTSLLFGRALAPVEGVVAGWRTFGAVRDAYRRLTDTLAAVAPALVERRSALPNPEGRLAVDNVSFCPPGRGNFLLRGISFPLNPGECLGVIGPSGAGKSLLGRLIAGVATPTIGRVTLDSVDVALWRQAAGGKHLGYLPQEVEFFGGSVGSIIARLTDADASEVVRAAKLLGMHEDIMRLPQAYETDMNEALPALRLGQRQRIGIARACFGNPRLIVLDEPNSTLDFHGERLLFQAIEQLKACGATVVVITHRMGILPATDKIAILEAGNLVAFGRSQDIFERYLRRARIDAPSRPDPASKPPGAGHRPLPDRHRSEDAVLAAPEEGTVS